MGLLTTGVFLFNVLCALVPCDPALDAPEVRIRKHVGQNGDVNNDFDFSPVVTTKSGGLEGHTISSTEGRPIFAFEGIPYAEPPMNELRFRSPQPKAPWLGIHKAQKKSRECLQLSPQKLFRVIGHEDCLYLNIYTRRLPDFSQQQRLLPVIFYIYGGSYIFGDGADWGPAYLLNHEVVLVNLNYRVGVLGFMSSGDSSSPGNYGLKDQALALKWVSENIEYFGGNPKNITLMGQSSGAASAHFHLMSPQSRSLFQSGVSLSGSAFTHWAYKSTDQAKRLTDQVAKMNRCPIDDRRAMVNCLRRQNPVSVVSSQFRLMDWFPFPIVLFAPVIEPEGPEAFLTISPQEFYAKANSTREPLKPWIFSMTSDEGYVGLLFLKTLLGERSLRRRWSELAPAFLDFKHTAEDPPALANELASLYFGQYAPNDVPAPYIAQLFGDRLFLHGIFKAISLHSLQAPTYPYLFQFKGKYNAANVVGYQSFEWGVGHSEDLFYYFNNSQLYPGFKRSDKEYQLSHVLTTLLTNFADKGVPLMSTDDGKIYPVWDAFNPRNPQFLKIDWDIKMIPQPMLHRFHLWDNFPPQIKRDLNLH